MHLSPCYDPPDYVLSTSIRGYLSKPIACRYQARQIPGLRPRELPYMCDFRYIILPWFPKMCRIWHPAVVLPQKS